MRQPSIDPPYNASTTLLHRFRDFKGFLDAGLNLFQPVTLLVGKNASDRRGNQTS